MKSMICRSILTLSALLISNVNAAPASTATQPPHVIAFAAGSVAVFDGSAPLRQYEEQAKQFLQAFDSAAGIGSSLIIGKEATRAGLRRVLQQPMGDATLILYLSGGSFEVDGRWVLATADTTWEAKERLDPATGVTGHDLVRWIRDSGSQRVLLLLDTDTGPGLCPPSGLQLGPEIDAHMICTRTPNHKGPGAKLSELMQPGLQGEADQDGDGLIRLFELVTYLGRTDKERKSTRLFMHFSGSDLVLIDRRGSEIPPLEKLDGTLQQLAAATSAELLAEISDKQRIPLQDGLIPVVLTSNHDSSVVNLVEQVRGLGGLFQTLVGAKLYVDLPYTALLPLAANPRVWNMNYNWPTQFPVNQQ